METHASDEISKERQRRSQQGGGPGGVGGGDVIGLEGGMAGVSLRGGGGEGEGDEAEEANDAEGNNGEKSDGGGDNDDDDDEDEDCDYVPENYHDENSKNFTTQINLLSKLKLAGDTVNLQIQNSPDPRI